MTTEYFAGASTTTTGMTAGATGPPGFSPTTGTQSAPVSAGPTGPPAGQSAQRDVTAWLHSPEARQYEGRWVLLSDQLQVLDSDSSPTALLQRHQHVQAPLIVFVDPANTQLAV
jgi:hypothetical protein